MLWLFKCILWSRISSFFVQLGMLTNFYMLFLVMMSSSISGEYGSTFRCKQWCQENRPITISSFLLSQNSREVKREYVEQDFFVRRNLADRLLTAGKVYVIYKLPFVDLFFFYYYYYYLPTIVNSLRTFSCPEISSWRLSIMEMQGRLTQLTANLWMRSE